ncbi:MurR/RpiR family transcriptional regulator [Eubacteriales bacterium DFI.9.88]|uniref:MurR/RpiR family transcriptional regulator n=1 Tax=Hominibacterium faecale TaxID=2839743 RepID=UPI0022B2A8D7|nr:MurR/RpiR family transcriptional regulator [Hominibacterium faecale]MDE8734557.1 MurR/RpiR family transcriptional regulator [Eubacteriales bacterium DFI.9.88]
MNEHARKVANVINQTKVNIEDLITKKYEILSKGEKKVASYIQSNYVNAVLLSSTELAQACGVSDTTVIRFAKDLGFKGFADFKKHMKNNINTFHSPYDFLKAMDEDQEENDRELRYLEILSKDIEDFSKSFDYSKLESAVDLILKARTIYCVGIGTDSIMISFLATYFRKIGLDVIGLTEGGIALWDGLLKISEKDIIILSSFPRYLKDEQRIGQMANDKNIPLITITNSEATDILWHSDINFLVKETQKTYFNSMTIPSIICNLILLKILDKEPEMVSSNMQHYLNFSKPDWL